VSTAAHAELTRRHYALLRAAAAGRCELTCSREPDLYIDGRSCSDQQAGHLLVHTGLIEHATAGCVGQRVAARLTAAGAMVLSLVEERRAA
jgi:hypothetical protein